MNKYSIRYCWLAIIFLFIGCSTEKDSGFESVSSLPFQSVEFQSMNDFDIKSGQWIITGGVHSDFTKQASAKVLEGTGVLYYDHNDSSGQVSTIIAHRDLELQGEFLLSGGAQADFLLQGRYKVLDQIRDENQEAFLTPGLWQKIHLLYRSPKFDNNGNIREKAIIEKLYLNGKLIAKEISLEDTSPGELEKREFLILEGIGGPVAFKNLKYKRYEDKFPVELQNLKYEVFDYTGQDLPGFDTLEVIESGTADSLNVSLHSPKDEYFAMTYSGDLIISETGTYLFEIKASEKAELYIDGEKVIPDNDAIDGNPLGATIYLDKGTHTFYIPYYQEKWSNYIQLMYEGPQIEKQPLASRTVGGYGQATREIMITMEDTEEPERVGSFAMYNGTKRTHILSVGSPNELHYSYDLRRASLLNMWKGSFADVTKMWFNRGQDQLLLPLNISVSGTAGIPVAKLNEMDTFHNHALSDKLKREKYVIDDQGYPEFTYLYNDTLHFTDKIIPSEDGERLNRWLEFSADEMPDQIVARLAQAKHIEQLDNGYYRINGTYYLGIDESAGQPVEIIESPKGTKMLIVPLSETHNKHSIKIHYIW